MSRIDPAYPPLDDTALGRWKWLFLLAPVLIVALFTAGFLVGHASASGRSHLTGSLLADNAEQFQIFWEAWKHVEQQFCFPTPVDEQAMTYGAIRGLLASLRDPHTVFVQPAHRSLENDALQGEFGGIGVLIMLEENRLKIVEVTSGSAAEEAGLQPGDALLSVDGTEIAGLDMDEVVLLVRGEVGTTVQLTVQRGDQTLSFQVVRQQVELPSLSWQLLPESVAYIQMQSFTGRTDEELSQAIESLRALGAQVLVLDLRGNGGGVVEGATNVLGQLLGHGIAFRELRKGEKERRHPIPFGAQTTDWPLAVLVDQGTASAAEIVAAAVRDCNRGVLIGEPTYGKGSMQGIFELSDGSSVHVTIAHWLSSDGRPIEGVGVQPDIILSPARDEQGQEQILQAAIEYLVAGIDSAIGSSALDVM